MMKKLLLSLGALIFATQLVAMEEREIENYENCKPTLDSALVLFDEWLAHPMLQGPETNKSLADDLKSKLNNAITSGSKPQLLNSISKIEEFLLNYSNHFEDNGVHAHKQSPEHLILAGRTASRFGTAYSCLQKDKDPSHSK